MGDKLAGSKLLFPSLLAFRFINSLLLRTHFEPDEYFQSVEVAMALILKKSVFTWEWFYGIRSAVFVGFFYLPLIAAKWVIGLGEDVLQGFRGQEVSLTNRREGVVFMAAAPYVVKAVCALVSALGDYSTIQAYKTVYGIQEAIPVEIVLATAMNIGLWLYSTRSHINSFEMAIGIYIGSRILWAAQCKDKNSKKGSLFITASLSALLLYLRPTSIMITLPMWAWLLYDEVRKFSTVWRIAVERKEGRSKMWLATYLRHSRIITAKNLAAGLLVLGLCCLIDSLFYGEVTFTPYEFFRLNIICKISHIFGVLPMHYVFLFFSVLMGGYTGMLAVSTINYQSIVFLAPMAYLVGHSLIMHKEMRFLLPAVPMFNIIVARNLKSVMNTPGSTGILPAVKRLMFSKKVFVGNLILGIIIGVEHQNIRRPLSFLREECTKHLLTKDSPLFILSTFKPYMLPMNTYLGHRRIITRTVDNNPNLTPWLTYLKKKKRFDSPKYPLVLEEHEIFSSRMLDNIVRAGPLDYNFIVVDSQYEAEVEERLPQFIKVHGSSHVRVPWVESVSIYKRAVSQ
ncbi:phosphatidylinositol glycan, class B [Nematocida displodere]|uniref:Mannosyltransferase n=1 Tax=Nematocida displodere TaxID=1805483 RepID=A0A177EFF1_9MICR|nr:phosphatidylinositol glycan, class B [Nematocida displodere]